MVNLLVFRVGNARYALHAEGVREVVRAVAITPLPHGPRIVEGIIDVRGTVTPVLNLRRRLGAPDIPLSVDEHFVIAEAGARLVAFRADPGTELSIAPDHALQEIQAVVRGTTQVSGVATLSDGVVLVHDLAAFLSSAEADELETALGGKTAAAGAA